MYSLSAIRLVEEEVWISVECDENNAVEYFDLKSNISTFLFNHGHYQQSYHVSILYLLWNEFKK